MMWLIPGSTEASIQSAVHGAKQAKEAARRYILNLFGPSCLGHQLAQEGLQKAHVEHFRGFREKVPARSEAYSPKRARGCHGVSRSPRSLSPHFDITAVCSDFRSSTWREEVSENKYATFWAHGCSAWSYPKWTHFAPSSWITCAFAFPAGCPQEQGK